MVGKNCVLAMIVYEKPRFQHQLCRAVATFEATEAVASVVLRTVATVKIYFDQSNFTFDCHDYIAVTYNRNCSRLSSSVKRRCSY